VKRYSWRIVKQHFREGAFSGEGARLYGGRWNSPGHPVVYTAEHASLAMLEILAHLEFAAIISDYVLIRAEFDEALLEVIETKQLPRDWRIYPAPQSLRTIGDQWLEEKRSAVLSVPSVIVPVERLYLFNPLHADFKKIAIGEPQEFPFDTRLRKA
jgi:RES domain-containing protein